MNKNHQTYNINISILALLKVVLVAGLVYFVFLVSDILILLFIAVILSSAVKPWVDWMHGKKIPRPIGMLVIYLILALLISMVIYLIIPPIAEQLGDLSRNFPSYLDRLMSGVSAIKGYADKINSFSALRSALDSLSTTFQDSATGVFSTVTGIFGSIFSFFLVLVITFYMTVEVNAMRKVIWSTVPMKYQPYVIKLIDRMQVKIGNWLSGQLVLCLAVGILTFIGLKLLGVKYALTLAILAGMLEFIPYLGPTISAIPAVFLAFSQDPKLALFVAIFYYIIQVTENNLLVPKVMQKAVGLNPIVSITVLLIGFKLAGIAGAILSIPVSTAASVFIEDIFENRVGDCDIPVHE